VRRVALTLRPASRQGPVLAAVSDGEGHFLFENVEPATYRLSAERTGFLRQDYGAPPSSSAGARLEVSAGQQFTDLVLKLTPQGVITGKVLDQEGEPAANVEVAVLRQTGFGGSRRLTRVDAVVTNDLGEFRIPELKPGSYLLAADGRDHSPEASPGHSATDRTEEAYVPSFYPGTTDPEAAVPVQVGAGQEVSGNNIQLQKTRVYGLRGKLIGASARSFQVTLLPRERARALMGFARWTALVTLDGKFEFRGVQTGSYHLLAVRTQGRQQIVGRLPVEVTGSSVDGLQLVAGDGFAVTGLVRVEGEAKTAPSGAALMLLPSEGPSLIPLAASVKEDGAFRIEEVLRDRYRLNFHWLPEGTYVKSVRMGGLETPDKALDLTQAVTDTAVEITLGARAGGIQGQVQVDGKPAAGSLVTLVPEPVRPNQPFLYKKAFADLNGLFQMTGLAPGDYKLYAWEEDAEVAPDLDPDFVRPFESAGVKVRVVEGGRESVELKLLRAQDAQR